MDVSNHFLVSKHSKLAESEKRQLLEQYKVELPALPKIFRSDSAITKLNTKVGDVIKVERASKTAGTFAYYRVVIDG
ncbi:MAG: DNA-directed RNA polymerase subunit H [Nanoarchaeota archaeon]